MIGGRQSPSPPPVDNFVVIGQEYSDFRETETVQSRHVVGSRYSGDTNTFSGGRTAPARGFTVVGAGFKRRRRNVALEEFLSLVL